MTPALPEDGDHGIHVRLDHLIERKAMTWAELADRIGISPVNLSRLRNGHTLAVRYSTLGALCRELDCQPGDILAYEPATTTEPEVPSPETQSR